MAGSLLARLVLLGAFLGLVVATEAAAQPVSAAAIAPHPDGVVRIVARPVGEGRTEIRWQRYDAEGIRVGADRLLRRISGHVGALDAARMADGRTAVAWGRRTEWQTNIYSVAFTNDLGRRPRRPLSLGVFRAPAAPADVVLVPQGEELVVLHFGQTAPCVAGAASEGDCPELVVSTLSGEGVLSTERGVGWPNGGRMGPAIRDDAGRAYLAALQTPSGAHEIREAGESERCALPGCRLGVASLSGAELAFADGILVFVSLVDGVRYVGAWSAGTERFPNAAVPEAREGALPRLGAAVARCTASGLSLHLSVDDAEVILPAGEGATIPWHAFLDALEGASDSLWTGRALITLKSNGPIAAFVCVDGELSPRR